ncbi:multidrug efflux SMR transporter [Paenibacillus sp. TRM 82003]|nr:multidrug efflux SMR transporter [Paenibacillus sp. TRM 82003]
MKGWLLLSLAIALEVSGTLSMKYSDGFVRLVPSVLMFVCYAASFTLLNLAIKTIDVSIAYAIWSGVGTLLITGAGFLFFKETMTALKLLSIVVIVVGVVGLNVAAKVSADEAKTAIQAANRTE